VQRAAAASVGATANGFCADSTIAAAATGAAVPPLARADGRCDTRWWPNVLDHVTVLRVVG